MTDFTFEMPYTLRTVKGGFRNTYCIDLEEQQLLKYYSFELAKHICAALNGAYNIGRMDMAVEQYIEDSGVLKK